MDEPFHALYDEARGIYPDGGGMLRFKPTHREVQLIAHGWVMRVVRTCDAVMLLQRSELGTESWPLRRAALEHTIALRWVAAVGDEAVDVVNRVHAKSSEKRQEAQASAGWISATWSIWAETAENAIRATGNLSESHMLTNVTARMEKYGHPNDLAAWLIETANSHPGWSSAATYWDPAGKGVLIAPVGDGTRLDGAFCVSNLLRSLESINRMMETPVWDDQLMAWGDRYQSLLESVPSQSDPRA